MFFISLSSLFFLKFFTFKKINSNNLQMHTVCHHVLSSIRGYQCTYFVFATPSSSKC
ncbi:hypothetical protein AB205_0171580 [Aquarana catesbeiana]|uniref:Uncharacterized protein n=1 Tax=Aquarana catesbeiana TaxID=8400 RepID=A0A2G9Q575_AQUCT|nr:hypothetical protein AB205_0171580 [Aquarana catesbeiana]